MVGGRTSAPRRAERPTSRAGASRAHRRSAVAALALLLLLAVGCSARRGHPREVKVLAAASLVDLFQAAAPAVHRAEGLDAVLQFNASAEIRSQVERGERADVFVSASSVDMDRLQREGLIRAGTRRDLYRNRLVLVVPTANPAGIAAIPDLAGPHARRIAVGEPATVPAGRYAEQSLRALHLWDALQPRLVRGSDVRVVLGWVAQGDVDAGIVYATDVRAAARATRIAAVFPERTHAPIVYPGAVLRDALHPDNGARFLAFLAAPAGRALAAGMGFAPAPPVAPQP